MIRCDMSWIVWIMAVTDKSTHLRQGFTRFTRLWNAAPLSGALHVTLPGPVWDPD